jgi:hypothetical protein
MGTIKYNEIIWNTIKVLNLKKCSEIAQKFITNRTYALEGQNQLQQTL